jgi:gluconolactonase
MEIREVASGLQFPEGPVAMPDGSILVVEIRRGTLSRVTPVGAVQVVADLGGGPNGVAIGPDGAAYVVNNGGFRWGELNGIPIPFDLENHCDEPDGFQGGWVERVDLTTGERTVLYTHCGPHHLRGPNDIVFDETGGFWFTDLGKRRERSLDKGGLYYARPDGSLIIEADYHLGGLNGVGLSPDGRTVYAAETFSGRIYAWDLEAPGRIRRGSRRVVAATPDYFDSLAVEESGRIVVAALAAGLCVVDPTDGSYEHVPLPDLMVTNVCFGGPDLRTAYVTMSASGRLVAVEWPRPGLRLNF